MSIAEEIDATVAAFVAELEVFVRRLAEGSLHEALGELKLSPCAGPRPPESRRPRPARPATAASAPALAPVALLSGAPR